jgi:hypothetical protein
MFGRNLTGWDVLFWWVVLGVTVPPLVKGAVIIFSSYQPCQAEVRTR